MWFQEVAEPESYETLYELYDGQGEIGHVAAPPPGYDPTRQAPHHHSHPHAAHASTAAEPHYTHVAAEPYFEEASRRGRGRSFLLSGLIAIAVLASLATGFWLFKGQILNLVPQLEGVYAALPDAEPGAQFDFRNTAYSRGVEDGVEVLIVSGDIVNNTDSTLTMPRIRALLLTSSGSQMDQWEFTPRGDELAPGESRYFESRRANPPRDADTLRLVTLNEKSSQSSS